MEFGTEKCAMVIMKNDKDTQQKEHNFPLKKESVRLEKKKTKKHQKILEAHTCEG